MNWHLQSSETKCSSYTSFLLVVIVYGGSDLFVITINKVLMFKETCQFYGDLIPRHLILALYLTVELKWQLG